jgi:hypothetical protein
MQLTTLKSELLDVRFGALASVLPLLDQNTPLIQIFKKSATFPLFLAFKFELTVEN